MKKMPVKITLWLHNGEPDGVCTWETGDVFLSVFALKEMTKPEGHQTLVSAFEDLKDREALFLLTGEDLASDKPLLFLSAGRISEVVQELHGLMVGKASNFDRLLLLGATEALTLCPSFDRCLRQSGEWNLLNEEPDAELPNQQALSADLLSTWQLLLKVAHVDLPGLDGREEKSAEPGDEETDRAHAAAPHLYLTARGAKAEAKWEKRGLRILAGSQCSPLDPTPSLCQAYRQTINRLVNEERLKKIDGVWTFTSAVLMASSVQAASILARTSAGAESWKTEAGEPLTTLKRLGKKCDK